MTYVNVEDVAIIKTGTWDASTGEATITTDMVADIHAAWDSGLLNLPVIKIGHINPSVDNPDWGDGAPAYGQVDNLRIEDDGNTLRGDYIKVPEDLAKKLASAYPQRSAEIDFGVELRDQDGETVQEFPAVLTAVALLGASAPAVMGLDDVHTEFSAKRKGLSVHLSGKRTALSMDLALPGGKSSRELDEALRSLVYGLRDRSEDEWYFLMDWTDEFAYYQHEDIEPKTYQRPYVVAEDGTLDWAGEAVEVVAKHSFEPVSAPSSTPPETVPQPEAQLSHSDGTDTTSPVVTTATEGAKPMLSDEALKGLREQLELPEDATSEQIQEAVSRAFEANDTTGDQNAGGTNNEAGEQGAAGSAPANLDEVASIAAAKGGPELVQLSRNQLNAVLTRNSDLEARLSRIEAKQTAEFVDAQITEGKRRGKIHPKDEGAWRASFAANAKDAAGLLAQITPTIPVSEIGSTHASFAAADTDVDDQSRGERRRLLNIPSESEAK